MRKNDAWFGDKLFGDGTFLKVKAVSVW